MNPKHIDKISDNNRRAIAPYNFVELPEKVVEAELPLPEGDRYHLERHTGRIQCTLTTESPLYTRCGMTPSDFIKYSDLPEQYSKPLKNATEQQKKQWEEEKRQWETDRKTVLAPFFTYRTDLLPIIPGSSLRGMIRALVEIVSFSKIDRVSNNDKLFFRAVAADKDEPLKNKYKIRDVQAGYLEFEKTTNKWYIHPAIKIDKNSNKSYIPVTESQVKKCIRSLIQMKKDNYVPQYINISFTLRDNEVNNMSEDTEKYPNKGIIVTSGNMLETSNLNEKERDAKLKSKKGRKYHYIISSRDNCQPIEISQDAVLDYQSALTEFQKGKPFKNSPKNPFDENLGCLQNGRPIFYCENDINLFGQSPNFRIPYFPKGTKRAASVINFLPKELRNPLAIDLADAIFGWVKQEKQDQYQEIQIPAKLKQRAGRVSFTDARYESDKNGIWYKGNLNDTVTPKILASPKPTTFQHYLVQPKETNADKKNLKHYASEPVKETVIRGHKLYWHKPHGHEDIEETDTTEIENKKSQYTDIKPIKAGISFKFNIRFENLSNVELGALLWVLSLSSDKSQTLETGKQGEKYCFSLGMGKPLGMGAVKIDYELHLIDYELHLSDRASRYSNLFDGTKWKTGEEDQSQTPKKEEESVKAFEKYILDWICCQDYPKDCNREQLQHLNQLPRTEMLLAMLRCDRTPDANQTRYMTIEPENEYKNRPVLPTTLDVMEIPDNRKFNRTSSYSNSNLPKPIIQKSSPAVSNPKNQSNSPKPKPKKKSDINEGGSDVNFATKRPPKR